MEIQGTRGSGGGLPAPPAGGEMDKQAFLKLLVAQVQAQDPLSPMEGAEFVAQLAQFSVVEQQVAQSKALDIISLQLTGIASNETIGLIGKDVTVRGQYISFDGQHPTGFSANLEGDTQTTSVTIRDAGGDAVRTIEFGPHASGTLAVPWDGRDQSGKLVPPGNYTVEITATDGKGEPVETTTDVQGTVVGVSFEKGYPEVILDSGARAPISDLIAVHGSASGPSKASAPYQSHPGSSGSTAGPSITKSQLLAVEASMSKLFQTLAKEAP
ncbi:MAG: hypothetical protein EXR75_11100 [Myxococcales bacterium]|nr:hypothetical protein [Myxococcales bacterium]